MTCAIVLAAGRSQRMGTQKLLLPFADSTVIARVVDAYLGVPVDEVVVVVRQNNQEIRVALGGRPVVFVESPDPSGDMLSSIRCGLRALPPRVETVVVSPADQPSLGPGLIRRMLSEFRTTGWDILVPVHKGRRGHPLVFSVRYRDELLTAYEGVGLRGLLQSHSAEVFEWPSEDAAILEDVDTPSDYEVARLGVSKSQRETPLLAEDALPKIP